jgi:hypothetical protein
MHLWFLHIERSHSKGLTYPLAHKASDVIFSADGWTVVIDLAPFLLGIVERADV